MFQAPAPVPDIGDLNALQAEQDMYRQAENFIYSTIVETLEVGKTMHYARQCVFGASHLLLKTIVNDNRQETTRSLMAVFSALITLNLKTDETFEQFSRRVELLIQRLRNWRPLVVLPEQLILFCCLRALPDVPYAHHLDVPAHDFPQRNGHAQRRRQHGWKSHCGHSRIW